MKTPLVILAFVLVFAPEVWAQVPGTINLQTVVYDQDGNLTTEDFVNVGVQITDANGSVLFSEDQYDIPVVQGAISMHIGEASGGVPLASLDPATGRKFVNVLVNETRPFDLLPLDAVPYSIWADKALAVADNSIGAAQIKDGAIELRHLARNVNFSEINGTINDAQIPNTIARSQNLDGHVQSQSAHSASAITVDASGAFAAQLGSNVQVALDRIFRRVGQEIANRQIALDGLDARVTNVQNNLQSQITANDNDITNLSNRVTSNDNSITSLSNRMSTAEGNITTINTNIGTINNNIANMDNRIVQLGGDVTPMSERALAWGFTNGWTEGTKIFGYNYSSSAVSGNIMNPSYNISFGTPAANDNVAVVAILTTPNPATNTIKYVRIEGTSRNGFAAKCYTHNQYPSMAIYGNVTTCDNFYWVAFGSR